jgi:hypothetical protein
MGRFRPCFVSQACTRCNRYSRARVHSQECDSEIDQRFEAVKENYRVTDCKKCKTTKVHHTWTKLDLPSMAKKDEWLKAMLVEGYYLPMMHTHTTRHSITARVVELENGGIGFNAGADPAAADQALATAHRLLLYTIELQHYHFHMGNIVLRQQCWKECDAAWNHLPEAEWPT